MSFLFKKGNDIDSTSYFVDREIWIEYPNRTLYEAVVEQASDLMCSMQIAAAPLNNSVLMLPS